MMASKRVISLKSHYFTGVGFCGAKTDSDRHIPYLPTITSTVNVLLKGISIE